MSLANGLSILFILSKNQLLVVYSTFKCSFDEFVGEKVFSPSYSSAILAPPPPVFLTREFHGQRSLVGYSPWGHKKWTRLSTPAELSNGCASGYSDYGDLFPPLCHVYMLLYRISIIACLNVSIFSNIDRLRHSFWFTIGPLSSRSLTLVVGLLLKKSRQEGILNKVVVIRNFN